MHRRCMIRCRPVLYRSLYHHHKDITLNSRLNFYFKFSSLISCSKLDKSVTIAQINFFQTNCYWRKWQKDNLVNVRTQIRNVGVISGLHRLLVMYANRLALSDGAESVCIAVASAVGEFAADARARFIVILVESASARADVQRKIAHIFKRFKRTIVIPTQKWFFTHIEIHADEHSEITIYSPCPWNLPQSRSHCSSVWNRLGFPPQPP